MSLHSDEDSVLADFNSDGEDSRSGGNTSSGTSNTGTAEESSKSIQEEITKRETQAIFRLRALFVLLLCMAGASVSYLVYRITRTRQRDEFDTQFKGAAEKVSSASFYFCGFV